MEAYIELHRTYRTLTNKELEHTEDLASLADAGLKEGFDWRGLVEHRRVVLLAEAGAGKTWELRQIAETLRAEGKFALFIELEGLGRKSLNDSLSSVEVERLRNWAQETGKSGWFFLDAVDELKLTQAKFDAALRAFAKGVGNVLSRVHVVVSCRPNDWRAEADRQALEAELPFRPRPEEVPADVSDPFFEPLLRTQSTQRDRASGEKPSFVTVALMPLNERQIRAFARERGVDADALSAELDRHSAWDFVRRPQDLVETLALWKQQGRLGTREEQHEANIRLKLQDRPERPDNNVLSFEKARQGAERLALALALTRTRTLRSPEQPLSEARAQGVLEPAAVLPDWTQAQVHALLRRGLFDPATYGRIRLHHRSVQEYMAACRLRALRQRGMSIKALFALLFARTYGVDVLVPSMRPIAAWLALWLTEVRDQVIAREPEVLLMMGDPAALPLQGKKKLLLAFVDAYGTGGWRGISVPQDEVSRLAEERLTPTVLELWTRGKLNEDTRELLLQFMWKAPSPQYLRVLEAAALEEKYEPHHRLMAVKGLIELEAHSAIKRVSKDLLGSKNTWPKRTIATIATTLFPTALSVADLLALIRTYPDSESSTAGFGWQLKTVCSTMPLSLDSQTLRDGLTSLVVGASCGSSFDLQSQFAFVTAGLSLLCEREWRATAMGHTAHFVHACVVSNRYRTTADHGDPRLSEIRNDMALRPRLFWAEVALQRKVRPQADAWDTLFASEYDSLMGYPDRRDWEWLKQDLQRRKDPFQRSIALHSMIGICQRSDESPPLVEELRRLSAGEPTLAKIIAEATAPSRNTKEMTRRRELQKEKVQKRELQEEQDLLGWDAWRQEVLADVKRAFSAPFVDANIGNLVYWLAGRQPELENFDDARVTAGFNSQVTTRARQELKLYWRRRTPQFWTEREVNERNHYPFWWSIGLAGLSLEARTLGWSRELSNNEVQLALRYAMVGHALPGWLEDLIQSHPDAVATAFSMQLREQMHQTDTADGLLILQQIAHASAPLKKLVYSTCMELFVCWDASPSAGSRPNRSPYHLANLFSVVLECANDIERARLVSACKKQLAANRATGLSATWLAFLLRLDVEAGTSELEACLRALDEQGKIELMGSLFSMRGAGGNPLGAIPENDRAMLLSKLIRLAYQTAPPAKDEEHDGAYTPTPRDHAAQARGQLLMMLVNTPGQRARDELLQLASDPLMEEMQQRIRVLARERAANDSEFEAFRPQDLVALDKHLEGPPRSRDALFDLMMGRLGDLQHDISHHDFSDRAMLRRIVEEVDVQRTLAMRLQNAANGAFSVTRESEVADLKRTDIVLAAVGSLQKAVIEVKIADRRWSVGQLETALRGQLVQQYERHENCRAGCLLLTNMGTRETWPVGGRSLDWEGLLAHLQSVAEQVERNRASELRVAVFGLDLRAPPLGVHGSG